MVTHNSGWVFPYQLNQLRQPLIGVLIGQMDLDHALLRFLFYVDRHCVKMSVKANLQCTVNLDFPSCNFWGLSRGLYIKYVACGRYGPLSSGSLGDRIHWVSICFGWNVYEVNKILSN